MNTERDSMLQEILPRVLAWAAQAEADGLVDGRPLSPLQARTALSLGVRAPSTVRVVEVGTLPQPTDPQLRSIATASGMFGPDMVGLTLGHAIYIRHGHLDDRLLSHELRHVAQVEQAGTLEAFLNRYVSEILTHGYWDAPLEVDARAHEIG